MSGKSGSSDKEVVGAWLRSRRQSGLEPGDSMQAWFVELVRFARALPPFLDQVRTDGSIQLQSAQRAATFLRIDLFFPVVTMLGLQQAQSERSEGAALGDGSNCAYGWTAALDEFTDPVWRAQSAGNVAKWGDILPLGRLCTEYSETLGGLERGIFEMKSWEEVGRQLRKTFVKGCALLTRLEIEIAHLDDLEE